MGFYADAAQRTPIRSIQRATDVPEAERPTLEVLRTESKTFADVVEVDVVGIPKKCLEMSLPFDFGSCSGFSEAEWKFTVEGRSDTHIMKVVGGKLKIYRRAGTKIVVR
jgi:hypothetical protein